MTLVIFLKKLGEIGMTDIASNFDVTECTKQIDERRHNSLNKAIRVSYDCNVSVFKCHSYFNSYFDMGIYINPSVT